MSNGTCVMPECERKSYHRQLCKTHYEAEQGYDPARRKPATCDHCGADYMRARWATTPNCVPCSRKLRGQKYAMQARKNWPKSLVYFPECATCRKRFATRRANVVYCSMQCRPSRRWPTMPCSDCGGPKELLDSYCGTCKERRRSQYTKKRLDRGNHRDRARRFGVDYEPIGRHAIFERDGWRCGICNDDVDPSRVYPDPMSASIDHIVPLSLGGGHVHANVQCAHLKCNVRKGNRATSLFA